MIEVASYHGVDEIVVLGDYGDFYWVSQFDKDPRVGALLVEEIRSMNEGLDELDCLFPKAKKVFLSGNHEARLESYIVKKAPGLLGVTETRSLLKIDQRPLWSFQEFDRHQQYKVLGSDLRAFHRPKASSPKLNTQRTLVSSVYGDIHKIESAHAVGLDGKRYVSYCPGWLGDVSSKVFDYMPSMPQWQLGFSFVTVDPSTLEFYPDVFEIKDNVTFVYGKKFKA